MPEKVKLTKRIIERINSNPDKEVWIWDKEIQGFGIRTRPKANPTYALRWKDAQSRTRKYTIGAVSKIELDDARAIARQRFGEVAAGENPIAKRRQTRNWKETVDDLIDDAILELKDKGRSQTYQDNFKQQMRDYVSPHIGDMLIREVSPSDIDRILAKLIDRAALHNIVRAGMSRLFNVARRRRYRVDNPVEGTDKRHEEPRTRLLSEAELDAILAELDKRPGPSSDAMRLLYLTGSRPKELFQSRWQDFDLDEGIWTKPAQTVKQRRVHRVPLQSAALAVLRRMHEEQEQVREDAFLFPSTGKLGHLTTIKKHAKTVFSSAGVKDVRPYDLRKAFASRLVQSGADLRTVMSLTGHTQINVLMKHYAHVMDGSQKELLKEVFG